MSSRKAGGGRCLSAYPISLLRTGAETSVAFRSAKGRGFRGAKGDNPTDIDSPILSDTRRACYREAACGGIGGGGGIASGRSPEGGGEGGLLSPGPLGPTESGWA